jgi:hypothetical protein
LGKKYYQVLEMPNIDSALVANGNKIKFSHFIKLQVKLGDQIIFLDTYVCPSISLELILGAHFFVENNFSINFLKNKLEKLQDTRLYVSRTTRIPPHTRCIIYAALAKCTMGQEAIFEPSKSWIEIDCLIPRQLFSIDHTNLLYLLK